MGIVEEFEELKPILQEKWLDFYSKNKTVILKYLTKSQLVNYEFIFSILISLEPNLSVIISNYLNVCEYLKIQPPTIDSLLNILEITNHVNTLDKQVKEREEKMKNQLIEHPSPLDEFRNKNL
ncbi:hypothetical protein ACN4EE_18280 [Geminocystis sp. CENA526]|uniref:hypothetical protein n=1 Tax=Geminocystis sp. CENA526 TaxID=1355871 RepID=UPI003D6E0715